MPAIDKKLTSCSIFLYPSEDDAKAGKGWGGSGFLLGGLSTTHPAMVHLYAVTNDHVRLTAPVIRYGTGEPMRGTPDDWIPHPDGDDLAIRPLGLVPEREWSFVDKDLILSPMNVVSWDVGPGDDCLMVGRFIAPSGEQLTQPVVRFGNLSAMVEPIYQPKRVFNQDSFLVDMRSLAGFSGSPVFLYFVGAAALSWMTPGEIVGQRQVMDKKWLLGVDWGHTPLTQPVLDENENPLSEGWKVTLNTGMAAVVPAWKLMDLLNVEEIVTARDQQEEIQKEQVGAVMDSVP